MVEWANEPWLIGMVRILVGYRGMRRVSRGGGMGFKAAWEPAGGVEGGRREVRTLGGGGWVDFYTQRDRIGRFLPAQVGTQVSWTWNHRLAYLYYFYMCRGESIESYPYTTTPLFRGINSSKGDKVCIKGV